jgi:catechol 2,3-dioxygenase-like lactoylglutathione lyase family enzyme
MSLRYCPISYVFLETSDLDIQRDFLESGIGLQVLEVEISTAHRHGVIKYDGGSLILSLNVSPQRRFRESGSDRLTLVLDAPSGWDGVTGVTTDAFGHRYQVRQDRSASTHWCVAALRLSAERFDECVWFYREVLGLAQISADDQQAVFDAGAVCLILERNVDVNGGQLRQDTYLIVFHAPKIADIHASLAGRGVAFKGRNITAREFGKTVHFDDPAGNSFCLYEPSPVALTSPSGHKIQQISAACDFVLPRCQP